MRTITGSPRPLALLLALGLAGCTGGYQRAVPNPPMSFQGANWHCNWKWAHTPEGVRQNEGLMLGGLFGGAVGGAVAGSVSGAHPFQAEAKFVTACMKREGWVAAK